MTERFNLENYVSVNERIQAFWAKNPSGRIITEIVHLDPPEIEQRMVVVLAEIWLDGNKVATGLAKEREGTFGANKTAFVENAETSAIGRALANMGYLVDKGRASKEEMEAVGRREEEHAEALRKLKTLAGSGPEPKSRVKINWDKAKEDPVFAIKLAADLEREFSVKAS